MQVRRLTAADEAAIEERLDEEPIVNLFLRGFLASQGVERAWWYGVERDGMLTGLVLLLPDRLMVPWCPDIEDGAVLGAWLARRHQPTLMVGPRDATDAILGPWMAGRTPHRRYDQRLYLTDVLPPGPVPTGLRRARNTEWPLLAERAARMEWEDLGRDPSRDDPELHARVVQDRIASGKTLVMEEDGHLVFQLNLGTSTRDGIQVGGTYVPPRFRGRGLSVRGMHAALAMLLRRHPRVTLHVNERNTPAVRCYERVGFQPYAPYRLVVP